MLASDETKLYQNVPILTFLNTRLARLEFLNILFTFLLHLHPTFPAVGSSRQMNYDDDHGDARN